MLLALVAANLALDFGLWHSDGVDGFLGLFLFVPFGTALSQVMLLAVWFTCMEGPWWWQFGVPIMLTAWIGYTAAIGLPTMRVEPWALLVFPLIFQFPLFVLAALLWPLCRMRGWRLASDPSAPSGPRGQFRIADVLIWMTIIGVLLAFVRFLFMSGRGAGSGIWLLLAFVLLPIPLLWTALTASLSPWPSRSWRLAGRVIAIGLYAAVAFAICARMLYDSLMDISGLPGYVALAQSVALTALFFVGTPSLLALNCLALRLLGWRLVRPESQARESKLSAESSYLAATSS
jgi:hypothetical protein